MQASQHPQYETVIVGAGFAGLGTAIKLKEAGNDNFIILEKAGDVGGAWRENTYPGCACDVQSHLYSFSFEPNPKWSRMFAPQQEIWDYLRHCAQKYELLPHIRFNTEVTGARFDEFTGTWSVETNTGEKATSRFLVLGLGGLHRPAIPQLRGLNKFKGKTFHSAEWDHGYDLQGKRVAVVGTGASAIQFVPQIQPKVAELNVFQRTPPWVMPKPDRRVLAAEQFLFEKLPVTQKAARTSLYMQLESRAVAFTLTPAVMKVAQKVAEGHIRSKVKDPVLRNKLIPDYTMGCKRVLMSNDYYPALVQPNVNVISEGIREVTAHGVVTNDGVERKVDAIIFGTGFRVTDLLTPLHIHGRNGVDINDVWANGMEAYLGTTIAGFPNAFMLTGPNTGLGHNSMVFMIEAQIHYILEAMKTLKKKRAKFLDVKRGEQDAFNLKLQPKLEKAVWSSGCKSWYLDANGKNTTAWPGFTFDFWRQTRRFNSAHYEIVPAKSSPATRRILGLLRPTPAAV
jgi:cyclohexanone monooxygenase